MRLSGSASISIAVMIALAVSHRAVAQQQYKLSDQDTWVQTTEIDPESPEGKLAEVQRLLANQDYVRAERAAARWIEQNSRHQLIMHAYLARGDALLAQGEDYKALFDYEYIARVFPGSEVFVSALEREFEIASAYAHGKRRKIWGMRIAPADDEAEELLIRIQERLPGSQLAEKAGMELGDFYFARGSMKLAADAYELFLENYPRSAQLSKARQRLIAAHLATFRGPDYETAGLYEAQERLLQLQAAQPALAERLNADALLVRIDESAGVKLLQTARWYMRTNDPIAAEMTIRRLVKRYPNSVAAADALRMVPQVLEQLPQSVINAGPDYRALRAAVLGIHDDFVGADRNHDARSDPPASSNSSAVAPPAERSALEPAREPAK